MDVKDYGYCQDCDEYFDLWVYGDIESAGHEGHNWRYVNESELEPCIGDCKEWGCFENG